MELTLGQIAERLDVRLVGDPNLVIRAVAGVREAKPGDITFVSNPKYQAYLEETAASAVIVQNADGVHLPCLETPDPYAAFLRVLDLFQPDRARPDPGVHPMAVVAESARVGANAAIGPHVVIEPEAWIGENVVVMAGTYIGHRARVGDDCWLYPNVVIREDVSIGKRVLLHPGVVIGSDGFGFTPGANGNRKIPQIGSVVVEDDVEIGSNSAVDRATVGVTRIGKGTRIDNLVHIAHNVEIGQHSILCAQVGISGSTRLGKNVILAGQAGLVGHILVGDGARVGAQGGVTKSIPPGDSVSGYPAMTHFKAQRVYASLRNLPNALRTLRDLERRLEELEGQAREAETESWKPAVGSASTGVSHR